MPINKNAYLRYLVFDKCFSNFGRKYFWQDLLKEVNKALREENGPESSIARSQLFKDISFMETSLNPPAELGDYKDGRRKYYRYTDPNFSIDKQLLNKTERKTLKEAVAVLSKYQGLPQFEWLNELVHILSDK